VLEYKAYGKVEQFRAVDEAIRTAQFMLCHLARARELVRKGRAVRRFRKGFFYIRILLYRRAYGREAQSAYDAGRKAAYAKRSPRGTRCACSMFLAGVDTERRGVSGAHPHGAQPGVCSAAGI